MFMTFRIYDLVLLSASLGCLWHIVFMIYFYYQQGLDVYDMSYLLFTVIISRAMTFLTCRIYDLLVLLSAELECSWHIVFMINIYYQYGMDVYDISYFF